MCNGTCLQDNCAPMTSGFCFFPCLSTPSISPSSPHDWCLVMTEVYQFRSNTETRLPTRMSLTEYPNARRLCPVGQAMKPEMDRHFYWHGITSHGGTEFAPAMGGPRRSPEASGTAQGSALHDLFHASKHTLHKLRRNCHNGRECFLIGSCERAVALVSH
ncbi:uncharacterized protein LAESUDRAFT_344481 [Laetiporus sulphureus 93-53]|uniref:Uncharacterized protein n=1 Tax=Laetiporus sulphureus 93-53 TaxID=1314785 RepID=A0A165GQX1_9APHY|nr:uncharacterized protein LAESUDRAFT_344481 [Laetiporus sulphureus 93-53]KZT10682.1 hypothetical protein LAESUDRAFT_344481 [Laetiporus sulphureus 93-53]